MTTVHYPNGKVKDCGLPPAEAVVAAYEESRGKRPPYQKPFFHDGYCLTADGRHYCNGFWAATQGKTQFNEVL